MPFEKMFSVNFVSISLRRPNSSCDTHIHVSVFFLAVLLSKTTACHIVYTVVVGAQIGQVAIIYERIMINVK